VTIVLFFIYEKFEMQFNQCGTLQTLRISGNVIHLTLDLTSLIRVGLFRVTLKDGFTSECEVTLKCGITLN
jgi:hypothetical protein